MIEEIDKLILVTIDDKNILKDAYNKNNIKICNNMSIFSNLGTNKTIEPYQYYFLDDDVYYLNLWHQHDMLFFVDKNKKILFDSRYYFMCSINNFIKRLDEIIKYIDSIDLNNTNIIENINFNVVAIQNWFVTYGHFKDEMFNLCNFYNIIRQSSKLNEQNCKILCEFHTNTELIKHYNTTENYEIISRYLFPNNFINPYLYGKKILKFNSIHLIKHLYHFKTFHLFPKSVTTIIFNNIGNTIINNKNVFITRGIAKHICRNINNQQQIEDFFVSNNYILINPENICLNYFINNIRNSDNVIITWGGALVNMIYLKENANVCILKSESYKHESIDLFSKIIKELKLNVNIIVCDNFNNIDIDKIKEYLMANKF